MMTPNGKSTFGKVIAGVAVGVIMAIIGMVLATREDVSALKPRIAAVEKSQEAYTAWLETIRKENRDEHQRILDEIKELRK